MIVMPGFVDSHRHIWEGLLRNIGADVPLEGRSSYISHVLHKLAPAFRPEDAYMGNLISALGAIDAGITTLCWTGRTSRAHPTTPMRSSKRWRTPACGPCSHGFPWWGKEERQPSWFMRAATEHFDPGPDAHPGAGCTGPGVHRLRGDPRSLEAGREAGARITTHVGVGSYGLDAKLEQFGRSGVLGPDTTYIHCTTLNDTEIQMIVDTGGTVSLAAPVEMMMGHGMPRSSEVPRPGFEPQPQRDETNVPSDMFNQMRSVLPQRAFAAGGVRRRSPLATSWPTRPSRAPGQMGSTRWGH